MRFSCFWFRGGFASSFFRIRIASVRSFGFGPSIGSVGSVSG